MAAPIRRELKFHTRRVTHRADLVVVENLISYDGAPWMYTVSVMEFGGDRVAHERIYIMDGWDARSGARRGGPRRRLTRPATP